MDNPKRTYIIVHHTGAEEADALQVKRYHLSLGWRDVGYNYIIERSGRVVNGRPLDIPGAHCRAAGMNRRSVGVSVIGNLEEHPSLPAQREALLSLLKELCTGNGIPVRNILGHREVPGAATLCPGRFLEMDILRRALDGRLKIYPPDAGGRYDLSSLSKKPAPPVWRVQAGAFQSREAAERQARKLCELGIDAILVAPD